MIKEYIKNNLKKVLIVSIIVLIAAIGTAYYFFDYQSSVELTQSDYTIYQGDIKVDFNNNEIGLSKILQNCLDVKTYTFCGSFVIKKNK